MPSQSHPSVISHSDLRLTDYTMGITSNAPQGKSVQGIPQGHAGTTSPQMMASVSALTLEGSIDGQISSEVINALQGWDDANAATSTPALGVSGNGQKGQTRTNPTLYRNTDQSSSQEPGFDGNSAQPDQNYGLQRFGNQELWEGPWSPGAARIKAVERAATSKSEPRSKM